MCGFFITNNPAIQLTDGSIVESSLRFRGPDYSSGLIKQGDWKAYHSRLSIISLNDSANQPVINGDGSLLVFNGEILNYKELGNKYFGREYSSDTLLLNDLIKNSLLDLNELDGFFAFVSIDASGKLEYAVRDHFGVKPLFVHNQNGYLSFSSEPNVLKELFNLEKSDDAVEEYLATRAPVFSGSYYDGVDSIDPGSCYVNGTFFDCSLSFNGKYESLELTDIQTALNKGISTRMVSDAPVGLLLSRGIDSNLLRKMGNFSHYYSIGFKGDEDLEFLKKQDIENLTVVTATEKSYKEDFEYLLKLRQEPMSVPNEVLLYRIAKRAAEDEVKVLLSGEGADEFFGGYDRIFTWALNSNFKLDKFLELYCYSKPDKDSVLYKKFKSLFEEFSFPSCFETVRWFFVRYHMPVLFRRLDFALMAAGVEGREPIANMHIFSKAIKIRPEKLMYEGLGKLPLRELAEEKLGKSFAFEKKVGFPVDLTKIFENEDDLTSYELWFKENLKVLK